MITAEHVTQISLPELSNCMLADDHNVVMPTHIFRKDGDILGNKKMWEGVMYYRDFK